MKLQQMLSSILLSSLILVGCVAEEPQRSVNTSAYEIDQQQPQTEFNVLINETTMVINGQKITRYQYTESEQQNYLAGLPMVMEAGKAITIEVTNQTNETTNVHWHGLIVPNDQDGPMIQIPPQQTHEYQFIAPGPGTYWYHAHTRPVRDQVDNGMYGPLVIIAPEDREYDGDHMLVLDDWTINNRQTMMMEQIGEVDTVNGLTGDEIIPLEMEVGELHKLRLLNASTAKTQYLTFPVPVRITHTDGQPLAEAQSVQALTIYPGERYDIEIQLLEQADDLVITNERDAGLNIPLRVTDTQKPATASPWQAAPFVELSATDLEREPDFTLALEQAHGGMHGNQQWLINGQAYPNTEMLMLETGKTYKIRYENRDAMHQMVHPMHIHGAHFRIVTMNDQLVAEQLWKDTVGVPIGGSVEILVTFTEPGEWMLHCHILDHEDGGMMLMLEVNAE